MSQNIQWQKWLASPPDSPQNNVGRHQQQYLEDYRHVDSQKSVACMSRMAKVAVLGAGVVGLSTAVSIQQRLPTVQLTVIADRFDGDTTSPIASGLFIPATLPGVAEDTLRYCKLISI